MISINPFSKTSYSYFGRHELAAQITTSTQDETIIDEIYYNYDDAGNRVVGFGDYLYKAMINNAANDLIKSSEYSEKFGYYGAQYYIDDKARNAANAMLISIIETPFRVVNDAGSGLENFATAFDNALNGEWGKAGKHVIQGTIDLSKAGSDVLLLISAIGSGGSSTIIKSGLTLALTQASSSTISFTVHIVEEDYDSAYNEIGNVVSGFIKAMFFKSQINGTGNLNTDGLPENDKITGYTKHGTEQALGRDGGLGVSNEAITNTIENPIEIIEQSSKYGPTFKYISEQAVVVLNEAGEVVTTYAKSSIWTRGGQ